MLQNRENQVAVVQVAARRNLDAALVVGRAHLPSMSKHRLYGKRPTSTWLPQPKEAGPGIGDIPTLRSRLTTAALMGSRCRYESEYERLMSSTSALFRIPAPAWAAFAIQRALQG